VSYDVLIVGLLERPAGTVRLLRQMKVPDDKVLMLRPDWPRPGANGKGPDSKAQSGAAAE
jgi:hypothetical protein